MAKKIVLATGSDANSAGKKRPKAMNFTAEIGSDPFEPGNHVPYCERLKKKGGHENPPMVYPIIG